jgi:hypothetical protein
MAANDYHFVTRWSIPGTCDEIYDILGEPMELSRWWPEVYLKVEETEPGEPGGLGRVIKLHTKGWLPYTLNWSFRVTKVDKPKGFALEAWGDFVGAGEWFFTQNGDNVDIVYDWKIVADKPLLKKLSFLLKPAFSANHEWAMAKGEAALRKELSRVRASRADMNS